MNWKQAFALGLIFPGVWVRSTDLAPGLYETGTTNLVYSWEQLLGDEILEGGVVHVADGVVTTNSDYIDKEYINASSDVLAGDLVLPSDGSVTTLGLGVNNFAFGHCKRLTGITIPESVTEIKSYAFFHCESLVSVVIPDSVTKIGSQSFSHCTGLASVTLPKNITTLQSATFNTCTSLTEIVIPVSVTSIGAQVFGNCTILGRVEYKGTVAQWGAISLSSNWYGSIFGGRIPATEVICSDGTVGIG